MVRGRDAQGVVRMRLIDDYGRPPKAPPEQPHASSSGGRSVLT
jgi:hypothetical protein